MSSRIERPDRAELTNDLNQLSNSNANASSEPPPFCVYTLPADLYPVRSVSLYGVVFQVFMLSEKTYRAGLFAFLVESGASIMRCKL